jgi:DNA-binding GntR family transcriptional regulator
MRTLSQRQSKVPKYLQLAELLRRQIERGELKPDDQLPSFPQLRAQHGVTNSTVEKVYGLLERDGLIVRLPSRGTFVAKPGTAPSNINQGSENSGIHARHGTIGVSGLGFSFAGNSSYWGRLLQGMREATEQEHRARA